MLHPYEVYLRERGPQGCRNVAVKRDFAKSLLTCVMSGFPLDSFEISKSNERKSLISAKLYREVVAMGYPGKRKQVARFIAHLRKQTQAGVTDFSAQPQGLTPRAAVSLLMRRPEKVTQEQQQALILMRQVHPEIEQVMEIVKSFLQMLRTLQGQLLEVWMERVQQSNIREMQNFVEKLRKDQDAVQAGLTLVWSNGVVEGHVNRLKCLKRTRYGRAKFDLLRQRVLYRSLPSPSGSFHEKCG
jgi:Transposase